MKTLYLLALLLSQSAHADWFCTTQASERRGDEIVACGKGNTRVVAFNNAVAEFNRLCSLSADCAGHKVIVTPKRMDKESGIYVRMVSFRVLPQMKAEEIAKAEAPDFIPDDSGDAFEQTAALFQTTDGPYVPLHVTKESLKEAWDMSVHPQDSKISVYYQQ